VQTLREISLVFVSPKARYQFVMFDVLIVFCPRHYIIYTMIYYIVNVGVCRVAAIRGISERAMTKSNFTTFRAALDRFG